jgi:sugar lactone lactonase YvrE
VTPNDLPVATRRAEHVALPHPTLAGLHAWRVGNKVGEAPNWDASTHSLLWIDIRAPAVLRLNPQTGELSTWLLPEVVGAMGLASGGCVVLALKNSLALLDLVDPARGRLTRLQTVEGEPGHNRLNDGKVSPSGRWFVFGSMDDRPKDKQPTGALFVARRDGPVRQLWQGLTVANGIAFSPDGGTLYFSDSAAGRVWQAPWDEDQASMGPPALMCTPDEAAGRPDGAAVDGQGHYWSAGVSAGSLNRFAPDGSLLHRLPLPCRAPTMPCFGGDGLSDIYVTSLVRPGWTLGPEHVDGDLLCFPASTTGLNPPRWT